MLNRTLVLILLCVSLTGWIGCGKTSSHYVYATLGNGNQVAAYREDPNSGVLTPIPGSPFPTGIGAQAIVLTPSRKFAYVANAGEASISLFTISSTGELTEVTPRTNTTATGAPSFLALDPGGNFLYVASAASNSIAVFSISSSGGLTQISGSPFPIGVSPINMKLAPSGNDLYVTGAGSPGPVSAFTVNAGMLTPVSGGTAGTNPFGLGIDPAGSFLYTANTLDNTISSFSIGALGALSPVSSSPFADLSTSPVALMVDLSGKYLYVANQGSNNVTAYSISSGALQVLSNSPFGGVTSPNSLAEDPSSKYLLVGNQSSSSGITVFRLDSSTGTLSSPTTYSTGTAPTAIVITQ